MISVAAILVMLYCLWLVVSLKQNIPGGVVGKTWRFLILLVAFFTLGYMIAPFFSLLPAELINLIVSLIFFFSAIYVMVSVRLVYRVIQELTD